MLIVVPSLIILALGTLIVLIIKAAFPTTVRREYHLVKKTILYRKAGEERVPEWKKQREAAKLRDPNREVRPSEYMVRDNSENLP